MATEKKTETRPARKPYSQPALKVHGSASDLTAAQKPYGSGDALFSGNSVVASDRQIKRNIRPLV